MVGDAIRNLREQKGMSREQLAETLGIAPIAIYFYENNKWQHGTGVISKLASALEVSIQDIVGECIVVDEGNGETLFLKRAENGRYCTVGRIKNG